MSAKAPRRRARRRRPSLFGILGLLPFLIVIVVLAAYPMAQVVRMSVSHISLTGGGFQYTRAGGGNFSDVLHSPDARAAVVHTLVFIVATVIGSIVAGVALALLVDRAVTTLHIARNVLIWPAVIAPVVVSLMWLLILSPTAGGLNKVLGSLGLGNQAWLNSGAGAMLCLVVVDIWHWTPIVFLLVYTSLQAMSQEVLEAARIDGASEGEIVRRIVLPLLRPAIAAVAVVRVVMGVKVFDEMYLLTAGGPNGATTLISQRVQLWFFQDLRFGYAAAFSLAVVAATAAFLAVSVLVRHVQRRRAA